MRISVWSVKIPFSFYWFACEHALKVFDQMFKRDCWFLLSLLYTIWYETECYSIYLFFWANSPILYMGFRGFLKNKFINWSESYDILISYSVPTIIFCDFFLLFSMMNPLTSLSFIALLPLFSYITFASMWWIRHFTSYAWYTVLP